MKAYPLLSQIENGKSVSILSSEEIISLVDELRNKILETVSHNGGHLASSLGAIEIIIALHRVFDTKVDKIIFDVGHQSYAHKLLTGRFQEFSTLRQKDGISGFPKRSESPHDIFNTGHSSTSISAALGMARARDLNNSKESIVAVIGDGALTGGMAFEALNDAGLSKTPVIVILNDNGMSISKNVGALTHHLNALRSSSGYQKFKRNLAVFLDSGKVGKWLSNHMESLKNRAKYFLLPNVLFESFGFTYLGPIDGHNVSELEKTLKKAKNIQKPVIVHAITKKGNGYSFAEKDPQRFHGTPPFQIETGTLVTPSKENNSSIFGKTLADLAKSNSKIVAITAAMPHGTGLTHFSSCFPDRFFDVGIAEQHALTMAAGMAVSGLRPVVAIYSSFLQRGYDQILHDICLQGLPVVLAVDRAGLVGEDGETHQGAYDISFLSNMPNMEIYSPASQWELKEMLALALNRNKPCAIRYSRSVLCEDLGCTNMPLEAGHWATLLPLCEISLIASGSMVEPALNAAKQEKVGLINARFLNPLDEEIIESIRTSNVVKFLITIEDGIQDLGFGVRVAAKLSGTKVKVINLGIPSTPIYHATLAEQKRQCGIDEYSIIQKIKEIKQNYEWNKA